MRKTITKEAFDQLTDEQLGWACIEQVLLPLRGKDADAKRRAYQQCSPGQQALMMFRVFYDHARDSREAYYYWVSELLRAPDTWEGVQKGMRDLGLEEMLALLADTKAVLLADSRPTSEREQQASPPDGERDQELWAAIDQLYRRFQQVEATAHRRVAETIRRNPHEFVQFEE